MRRQPARPLPAVKKVDGRHARKARTAGAIISALHSLLAEGNAEPTAAQIASRAGVAVRSIGQHFHSREELLLALTAFHAEQVSRPTPPERGNSFEARLAHFVGSRVKTLEDSATMRRAATRGAAQSKAIAKALAETARRRRDELRLSLGKELKGKPAWLNLSVELMTSGSTWDALRGEQHLTVAAAHQVVLETLRTLLA